MKLRSIVVALLLLVSVSTLQAMPSGKDPVKEKIANMTPAERDARMVEIKSRVETIRDLDKSSLTRDERKELRKEVRSLKKEAQALGRGGIYLSVGGILLIILILILIL